MYLRNPFIFITCFCVTLLEQAPCDACGLRMLQGKDQTTLPQQGSWPWMVSITMDWQGNTIQRCLGFLIDRSHALTAAHCFLNRTDPALYTARIGHVNWRQGEEYGIRRIDIPGSYKPGQFRDDIALFSLSREVTGAQAVCLPLDSEFRNLTGSVLTYGGRSPWSPEFVGPLELKTNALSNEQCNETFHERLPRYFHLEFPLGIHDGLICTLPDTPRGGYCPYLGGPLMLQHGNESYAVGVASYNYRCMPGYPETYTRITHYLDWIEKHRNRTSAISEVSS